ncbi:hypothetical protein B0H65DRAFT_123066 [Neurospora tetraspora]|uniref:Protein kinase domain-containing protein n=1 Tax=Neurospora tetraspora TaxID=94610 RepID=A0AAE0JLC1_9PEZI|nr:hypothetical protein B0H65DRAFT_123066 [Neurospora tetraspora]
MNNRERHVPAGPRGETQSPTRRKENCSPSKINAYRRPTEDPPMLSASSSNNHSLFSFGSRNGNEDGSSTSTAFEFLPSVSFDDLQSSLEADFKLAHYSTPPGQNSTPESMGGHSDISINATGARVAVQQPAPTRTARSGSILRRPSITTGTNRQAGLGTTASNTSGVTTPTAPAAIRTRRPNHYPPVSSTNNTVKAPRRSSLGERNGTEPPVRTSVSVDGGPRPMPESTRTSKARSVQPPPRGSDATTLAHDLSALALGSGSSPVTFPRSPMTAVKAPVPSSTKRISVMPGVPHTSHATGLGARTISPTDTRLMKRMSHHQPSQAPAPVPTAPMPLARSRPSSRSPSMLPRKIPTPASSRTTPDANNRKSYSSGLSAASANSYNTVRSSTGSIQPRIPQSGSSRLPAPMGMPAQNTANGEEEEEVPPVPAIPKLYDSPGELSFLDKRKSNRAFDTSSINSTSTGSVSGAQLTDPPPAKLQRKPSQRKSVHTSTVDKKSSSANSKKNLQPLRLPPLALGPLSTTTAAKIAALEQNASDRSLSPPPGRQIAKTPSTPMTASRSTYFTTTRTEDKPTVQHLRSTSTINRGKGGSMDSYSSNESMGGVVSNVMPQSGMSPYVSSSAVKGGNQESAYSNRPKTGDPDASVPTQKPSGPRAPKPAAAKSPPPPTDPEEPPTPSSIGTSIRRKLSLSWKRSASKNGNSRPEKVDPNSVKHDSMPPPRIPISATLGSMPSTTKAPSPTPSSKSNGTGTYLESRRRKSSASSLNAIVAGDRQRSDAAGKKESTLDTVAERSIHTYSSAQKILKPKSSSATLSQTRDVWTADLDKDDMVAEEEMKKLGSRRKETEMAARTLDALRKRATAKERVGLQEALRIAVLNIYERGEIVDYKDVYFCGTQNAAKVVGNVQSDLPNFGYDDERGDYSIIIGDHLAYRYEIIDVLGKGSFGQVVRCIDHKTGVLVAVKIIRNKKRFHQQALVEVNILQKLREWDPKNKHSMVNFTHSFYFRGHLCISTELLDMNLYEFIKSNAFRGFSLKLIRRFTKQMLSSLLLLKQHKVIHCDLKPENILLRHPLHSEIKVIDFGSSCFENEKVYTYIQSRFYRSPEVILGMTYGLPIDMWSLGCILAELFTGVPIFPGENEQEQLACIMEVFGPPEKHLIEKSTRKKLFFDSSGKPRLTVSSKGRRRRPSSKTLQQVLKCDDQPFLDFIARCLRWDPDRRMKPEEAVRHEFITGQKTPPSSSMPVPRLASTRESSPTKRVQSLNGGGPRPLPEPPAAAVTTRTSLRSGVVSSGMPQGPLKPTLASSVLPASRKVSGMTASGSGATSGVKRASGGTTGSTAGSFTSGNVGANGSSLPRAAVRTTSTRQQQQQDLAAAGATAAMMSRRA